MQEVGRFKKGYSKTEVPGGLWIAIKEDQIARQ